MSTSPRQFHRPTRMNQPVEPPPSSDWSNYGGAYDGYSQATVQRGPSLPPGAAAPHHRYHAGPPPDSVQNYDNMPERPRVDSVKHLQESIGLQDDLYDSIQRQLVASSGSSDRPPSIPRPPKATSPEPGLDETNIISMYADSSRGSSPVAATSYAPTSSSSALPSRRPLPSQPLGSSNSAKASLARQGSSRPLPTAPARLSEAASSRSSRPLPNASSAAAAQGKEAVDYWAQESSFSSSRTTSYTARTSPPSTSSPFASPQPSSHHFASSSAFYTPASVDASTPGADPFDAVTGKTLWATSTPARNGGLHSSPLESPSILTTPPPNDPQQHFQRNPSLGLTMASSPSLSPNPSYATSMTSVLRKGTVASRGEEPIPAHLDQALLSHIAMFVKDRVPRAEHTRGAIPYENSFTGQDVVSIIQRALPELYKTERKTALHIARSLHSQLFFFEVRDNTQLLYDTLDQLFVFAEDESASPIAREGSSSDLWANLNHREVDAMDELPTAVLVEVTNCYSPFCNRAGVGGSSYKCYSPSCPNSQEASTLKRQLSSGSDIASPPLQVTTDSSWAASVPEELRNILGKKEVKRQNQIHELITSQTEFVNDIDCLRTEFLEPLMESDPPIIPPDRQSDFFRQVLLNAFDVQGFARGLEESFQERQREQSPVIQSIGDLVYSAALDWGPTFVQYVGDQPLADAAVTKERKTNAAFDTFLNNFPNRPKARKLQFAHFHMRVVQRLPRYILLLKEIVDATGEDIPDREACIAARDLTQQQSQQANQAVAATQMKLDCRQYENDLIPHANTGSLSEMDLSDDSRQIFHRGKLLRRPDGTGSGFTDWTELFVILFDNFLVMTKPRARGNGTKYHISRRPIPLELLSATGFDDAPVTRSSGFHMPRTLTSTSANSAGSSAYAAQASSDKLVYPITFKYIGKRYGGVFILYADNARIRTIWQEKLEEATAIRESVLETSRVFELQTISDQTFLTRTPIDNNSLRDGPKPPVGRPTCSVSFQTQEGHQLVAIGHDEGLWIGLQADPTSFRLVLHLSGITQCTVLEQFSLVLVLADKALYAYPLEALVPSAASSQLREKDPQKLSGTKDVLFFKAGVVGKRLLVIYVKKSGVNQTVFKALEPIAVSDRPARTVFRKKPDWFRTYKEFFCPSETFNIIFLRSQLSIVCSKGFELMSLEQEPLRMVSFPDWQVVIRNDSRSMELYKRCNDSKALAMFRLSEMEFIFCYDTLAFYTDRHGDPKMDRLEDTIYWHATPHAVAYRPPYLLAFDNQFIEIRNATTGRLVQIITGRDMFCTFDNAITNAHVSVFGGSSARYHTVAEVVPTRSTILNGQYLANGDQSAYAGSVMNASGYA